MATKKNTDTDNVGDDATINESADANNTVEKATTSDSNPQIQSAETDINDVNSNKSSNENMTVQKDPLLITAKNNGVRRVFEPYSRTLIEVGEQVKIHCVSIEAVELVKNNLAQLNTLGRNIVYS